MLVTELFIMIVLFSILIALLHREVFGSPVTFGTAAEVIAVNTPAGLITAFGTLIYNYANDENTDPEDVAADCATFLDAVTKTVIVEDTDAPCSGAIS